jgi:DNA polymerase III alpha subunit
VRAQDGGPHDVLLCVQTGVTMGQDQSDAHERRQLLLKSRAQMEATLQPLLDLPASAFEHSLRVAEM